MNNFSWSKAIGYGVVIWALMVVVLAILGTIEPLNQIWAHLIAAAIGGIAGFLLARNADAKTGTLAAGYGIVWAAVVLLLDVAVAQWFDAHMFANWQYWIGPAVVFVAPWLETEAKEALHIPAA